MAKMPGTEWKEMPIETNICLQRGSWEGQWTSNRHPKQRLSYKGLIQDADWYKICSATGKTFLVPAGDGRAGEAGGALPATLDQI